MSNVKFESFADELSASVVLRAQYECDKTARNTEITSDNAFDMLAKINRSMHATLSDIQQAYNNETIAKIFFASKYSPTRILTKERSNAMINVYMIKKDVNIARTIAKVATLNHYTLAILKSAVALQKNEMLITQRDAESACTLDFKTDDAREALISACKYQSFVDYSTARTQASSSLNALLSFNILTEKRNAANKACFEVNYDNTNTKKLLALIA